MKAFRRKIAEERRQKAEERDAKEEKEEERRKRQEEEERRIREERKGAWSTAALGLSRRSCRFERGRMGYDK